MPDRSPHRNPKSLRNAQLSCAFHTLTSPTRFREDPFFGSRIENCLLSARHRALGTGRVCRPHILCLIPLDEDIPFLSHATARRLCRRSNIEIGVASSDITLALLQQHRVLGDPATVCSYPCHFGSPRRCYTAQQEARHSHKARHTCPSTRSRKQSTNKRHRSLSDVEGFMAYYV
jgi:hypothetical protein